MDGLPEVQGDRLLAPLRHRLLLRHPETRDHLPMLFGHRVAQDSQRAMQEVVVRAEQLPFQRRQQNARALVEPQVDATRNR